MCWYQSMVDADLLKGKAVGQLDSLSPEELHVPSYMDREKEERRSTPSYLLKICFSGNLPSSCMHFIRILCFSTTLYATKLNKLKKKLTKLILKEPQI